MYTAGEIRLHIVYFCHCMKCLNNSVFFILFNCGKLLAMCAAVVNDEMI